MSEGRLVNLLYTDSCFRNIDSNKLSTKHAELLEIQNKLCFYRKRSKNVLIKFIYVLAFGLVKIITFFEF